LFDLLVCPFPQVNAIALDAFNDLIMHEDDTVTDCLQARIGGIIPEVLKKMMAPHEETVENACKFWKMIMDHTRLQESCCLGAHLPAIVPLLVSQLRMRVPDLCDNSADIDPDPGGVTVVTAASAPSAPASSPFSLPPSQSAGDDDVSDDDGAPELDEFDLRLLEASTVRTSAIESLQKLMELYPDAIAVPLTQSIKQLIVSFLRASHSSFFCIPFCSGCWHLVESCYNS
jgi:hypothetical protein